MADGGVDIDLYADDIESDFNRQDEFGGDNVDLYDDVTSAPSVKPEDGEGPPNSSASQHSHPPEETNGNTPYTTTTLPVTDIMAADANSTSAT